MANQHHAGGRCTTKGENTPVSTHSTSQQLSRSTTAMLTTRLLLTVVTLVVASGAMATTGTIASVPAAAVAAAATETAFVRSNVVTRGHATMALVFHKMSNGGHSEVHPAIDTEMLDGNNATLR